jgi:hypothetical protein
MNSKSGSCQQHLTPEPPRVAGMTAKVAIDSVVDDVQCPSHQEASEGDDQGVMRQKQTQQQCGG